MKDIDKTIRDRHSVRRYKDDPLPEEIIQKLKELIKQCNAKGNLNIQLITDDSKTFEKYKLHYGKIYNGKNYFALVGKKTKDLEETAGYYGQKLVLEAQELGLNTCWVAGGYRKGLVNAQIKPGEKLVCIIALGYGSYHGKKPKGKSYADVSVTPEDDAPLWYKKGIEYALLAPTAMNQQRFKFELLENNEVLVKSLLGPMVKIDLGIVKYHFELGAGVENFKWHK